MSAKDELLLACAHCGDEGRRTAVNEVFTRWEPVVSRWAASAARPMVSLLASSRVGQVRRELVAEAVSEAWILWQRLAEDPERLAGVSSVEALTVTCMKRRLADRARQLQVPAGLTGMSRIQRRHELVRKATAQLTEALGRAPSRAEVIDHVNTRLVPRLAAGERQNYLLTPDDEALTPLGARVVATEDAPGCRTASATGVFEGVDVSRLVEEIVARAGQASLRRAQVASCWLEAVALGVWEVRCAADVAEITGVPRRAVETELKHLRQVARDVFADYGVRSETAAARGTSHGESIHVRRTACA